MVVLSQFILSANSLIVKEFSFTFCLIIEPICMFFINQNRDNKKRGLNRLLLRLCKTKRTNKKSPRNHVGVELSCPCSLVKICRLSIARTKVNAFYFRCVITSFFYCIFLFLQQRYNFFLVPFKINFSDFYHSAEFINCIK